MKRSTSLKRKTLGWEQGRSARSLAPRSAKRDAYEAELEAVSPEVMARARYVCEAQLDRICTIWPEKTPHHRKRRSQGGPNTMDNLMAVCSTCHAYIHAHPLWSYDRGLLIRRNDPILRYVP